MDDKTHTKPIRASKKPIRKNKIRETSTQKRKAWNPCAARVSGFKTKQERIRQNNRRRIGKDEVGSSNLPSSSKKHRKLQFSVRFCCKTAENGVGQNVCQLLTHTPTHTRKCADRFKEYRREGFAFSLVLLCSYSAYMTWAMKLPIVCAASSCFCLVAWV